MSTSTDSHANRSSARPRSSTRHALRIVLSALFLGPLQAEVLREQTIQLRRGWNAVHLEVHPTDRKPAEVFRDVPVDIVARYFRVQSSVEFIADPSLESIQSEGWGVWYAPHRPDAFLSKLHSLRGNECYLIHATADHLWKVTGAVRYEPPRWRNASFNLVGFTVDESAPPSFGAFFAGTEGRIGTRIYRLQEGRWIKVLNPAQTLMRAGEAFWTYCDGRTDYQGPLALELPGSGVLDFGSRGQELSLTWRTTTPSQPSVQTVAPSGSNPVDRLSLRSVERDPDTLVKSYPILSSKSLAGGSVARSGRLTIQARRDEFATGAQGVLLRITDGSGALAWIPVTALPPAN